MGLPTNLTNLWAWDNGDLNYLAPPDTYFHLGQAGDKPVIGDWAGTGVQRMGVYTPSTAHWMLDYGNNVYKQFYFGTPNAMPVVGDWNGSGSTKVGTFVPASGLWTLNISGDQVSVKSGSFGTGPQDYPIVGQWDGMVTKVGVFNAGCFALDMNQSLSWDGTDKFGCFGSNGDVPLVGQWKGDGITRVGTFRPSSAQFLLDWDGSLTYTGTDHLGATALRVCGFCSPLYDSVMR